MARSREPQPPPAKGGFRSRLGLGSSRLPVGGHRRSDAGPADEQERLIVEALGDLRQMELPEVMTPRVDVVALTIPISADDIARAVRESGHSCFPVVRDDLDDLVGVLYVNDLFRSGRRRMGENGWAPEPLDISRRIRQPYLVPESRGVLETLAEMRRHHRGFAVVVDEYGGVAGVVTVKDLLEPLVGDLHDEFDPENEPGIMPVDGHRWLIDGRANVDDVAERLGIEMPEGEYVTLGGLLFARFGHIPEEGECLDLGEWTLQVVEMDKRRVAKVVARRGQSPQAASPAARERDHADAAAGPSAPAS